MALTTRCPQCGTSFKVVADQLRIRNGLVRCGVCASVFDGRQYLSEADHQPAAVAPTDGGQIQSWREAAAPVAPPASPPIASQPPSPVAAPFAAPAAPPVVSPPLPDVLRMRATMPIRAERADGAGAYTGGSFSAGRMRAEPQVMSRAEPQVGLPAQSQAASPGEPQGSSHAEQQPFSPEAHAQQGFYGERKTFDGAREPALHDQPEDDDTVRGEPRTRYVDDYHSGRTPPSFMDEGAQAECAQRSRLWGVGCLILLALLLGMLVHTYRNQVATSFPTLRPLLEAVCRPLACTIGYERRIERISVMSSSLRASPGGGASSSDTQELLLTVVLRNRYNAPQPWPALSLELKDLADRVVVRKILHPHDYLPSDVASQPFGANAERRLAVPISVRNVQVNGYQIDKFFP